MGSRGPDDLRVTGQLTILSPAHRLSHVHVLLDEDLARAAVLTHPDSLEELHWGRRLSGVRMRLADVDEGLAQALLGEAHARRQPVRHQGARRLRPAEPVTDEDSPSEGEPNDEPVDERPAEG